MRKATANLWRRKWLVLFTAAIVAILTLPWLGNSFELYLGILAAATWAVVLVVGDAIGKTPMFNGNGGRSGADD